MDNKNKKILISIFIAVLMTTSIAGYIFAPQSEDNTQKKKYNNLEFIREGERWTTDINGRKISIFSDPGALSEQKTISITNLNLAQKIYLSVNPTENLNRISAELNNFLPLLTPRVITSCYVDIKECKSLPIKTCNDATNLNKVILIKIENITAVNFHGNCLEIKGSEEEILKFIDNLIVSTVQ